MVRQEMWQNYLQSRMLEAVPTRSPSASIALATKSLQSLPVLAIHGYWLWIGQASCRPAFCLHQQICCPWWQLPQPATERPQHIIRHTLDQSTASHNLCIDFIQFLPNPKVIDRTWAPSNKSKALGMCKLCKMQLSVCLATKGQEAAAADYFEEGRQ